MVGDPKAYYQALGLRPDALRGLTEEQIQDVLMRIHRAWAMVHHSDRGGNTQKMTSVNVAFDFLKDPRKRANYR